jgi:drug/metabolite transporter (DMT)-like permease
MSSSRTHIRHDGPPRASTKDLRRERVLGYGLAASAAVLWATGAVTAKWMFERLSFHVAPTALSGARALLAFAATLLYLLVFDRPRLRTRPRDLPFLAAFGVFGLAMVHFTYFQTIALTNVATAMVLEYLAPILVLLVSVAFLGERLTWALPVGVALSVTGTAFMVGALGGAGLAVSPQGIAWGLASAFFFALYTIMGKYAARRFSPWTLLAYGLGAASVFWLLILGPGPLLAILTQPAGLTATAYLAVFSTVLPFSAFLHALHHIEATKASVTATLEPVVAGVLAFLLLGEVLTPLQIVGGGLVLAAIVAVQAPVGRSAHQPAVVASPDIEDELPPVG